MIFTEKVPAPEPASETVALEHAPEGFAKGPQRRFCAVSVPDFWRDCDHPLADALHLAGFREQAGYTAHMGRAIIATAAIFTLAPLAAARHDHPDHVVLGTWRRILGIMGSNRHADRTRKL